MRGLWVLALAGIGCATSKGAGEHHLASMLFSHQLQPGWHLRSLSVSPAGDAGQVKCRPGDTPMQVDLVYARADGTQSTPLSTVRCAPKHSKMSVAVQQTPDEGFVFGKRTPQPLTKTAANRKSGETGLVPARALQEVPADIPPALQVSERGRRYQAAVCTDADGNVMTVRLISNYNHPEVVARVIDALLQWKYEPARLNGNPVPSCPWALIAF